MIKPPIPKCCGPEDRIGNLSLSFSGNPLAVFPEAEGITDEQMVTKVLGAHYPSTASSSTPGSLVIQAGIVD